MKTVLVIDDEFDILDALRSVLEWDGYQVVTAGNGAEGLKLMKGSPRPDLALVDVMMPVVTGLEFLKAVKNDPDVSQIPVVLMSAVHPRWPQEEYGYRAFLPKPFRLDELNQVLESILK